MKQFITWLATALFASAACADTTMPTPSIPRAFQDMKQLIGRWEGTGKMHNKEMPVRVIYELTSGGTAIIEKLMPGTPHEMISVYHKAGDSVAMTHYCSLGNQPHMPLKSANSNRMEFEMTQPTGLVSPNEPHMHAITLTLTDADTLKQEWSHYNNGKPQDPVIFVFKRVGKSS